MRAIQGRGSRLPHDGVAASWTHLARGAAATISPLRHEGCPGPRIEDQVGINVPSERLQTIPSGVGDHWHLPFSSCTLPYRLSLHASQYGAGITWPHGYIYAFGLRIRPARNGGRGGRIRTAGEPGRAVIAGIRVKTGISRCDGPGASWARIVSGRTGMEYEQDTASYRLDHCRGWSHQLRRVARRAYRRGSAATAELLRRHPSETPSPGWQERWFGVLALASAVSHPCAESWRTPAAVCLDAPRASVEFTPVSASVGGLAGASCAMPRSSVHRHNTGVMLRPPAKNAMDAACGRDASCLSMTRSARRETEPAGEASWCSRTAKDSSQDPSCFRRTPFLGHVLSAIQRGTSAFLCPSRPRRCARGHSSPRRAPSS